MPDPVLEFWGLDILAFLFFFFFFAFPSHPKIELLEVNLGKLMESLFSGFVLIIQYGQCWIPFQDVVG